MTAFIVFWFAYLSTPIALWLAARAIGVWLSRAPQTNASATLCGHCGYETQGLPNGVCPECGNEIAVVGLRTASGVAWRRWLKRLVPITWATLFLLAGIAINAKALDRFLPSRQIGSKFSAMLGFSGRNQLDWSGYVIADLNWDRDESGWPFEHWYPVAQRSGRLTTARGMSPRTLGIPPPPTPDTDAGIAWDAIVQRWTFDSPGRATETGAGWPPPSVFERWAADAVARYPGTSPLAAADVSGLAVAGGDQLIAVDRSMASVWAGERAKMAATGATTIVLAQASGTFNNDIRPLYWPIAMLSIAWLAMLVSGWRQFRNKKLDEFVGVLVH